MYHSKTNQKSTSHLNDFAKIFGRHHVVHTLALVILYSTVYTSYMGLTIFLPGLLQSLKVNPFSGAFIGLTAQIPGVLLASIITEWPWFGRLNSLRLFLLLSAVFFFLFAWFIQISPSIPSHLPVIAASLGSSSSNSGVLTSILSPCILYTVPF